MKKIILIMLLIVLKSIYPGQEKSEAQFMVRAEIIENASVSISSELILGMSEMEDKAGLVNNVKTPAKININSCNYPFMARISEPVLTLTRNEMSVTVRDFKFQNRMDRIIVSESGTDTSELVITASADVDKKDAKGHFLGSNTIIIEFF